MSAPCRHICGRFSAKFMQPPSSTLPFVRKCITFQQESIIFHGLRTIAHPQKRLLRHQTSQYSSKASNSFLIGETDKYKGVWVDVANCLEGKDIQSTTESEFDQVITASLQKWKKEGVTSVWLKVPIELSKFIGVASQHGFLFHHAEGSKATLCQWMDHSTESKIPMFATHQVGVSGIVINEDTREVLVVQDKNRYRILWKFPGGLSDLNEDIAQTAEREVFEETGVKAEFQSILAFRQQHSQPGAFGRSDIYILCRLKPLSFELNPCEEEIQACEWMPIERLLTEQLASTLTHRMAAIVTKGLDQGFDQVDIRSNDFESIHKGLIFQLFHRPL